MTWFAGRRPQHCRARRRSSCLPLERLESRNLLAGLGVELSLPPIAEMEFNDTLNAAQLLIVPPGDLPLQVSGRIGLDEDQSADVDWYRLDLIRPANVGLLVVGDDDKPHLALYDANPDSWDFSDPFALNGHRLVARVDDARRLSRDLAAGTYYIAVSGEGNQAFHPFLAESGLEGKGGGYTLSIKTTDLVRNAADGPRVLSVSAEGDLLASPLDIRINFDEPIAIDLVSPGYNVRLLHSMTGTFGDGSEIDVNLASLNYSPGLQELRLVPTTALAPGHYQLFLMGNSQFGDIVVAGADGVPLGATEADPLGGDVRFNFRVIGVEGRIAPGGANDTVAHAHNLGRLTPGRVVQAPGAIGDDPAYDLTSSDFLLNPSSDVDFYRFSVVGPGHYAVLAEVFAGRFGSTADPGVSLYRISTNGRLVFIDGNNNSMNPTVASNGILPFLADPILFAGVTAGNYIIAVASNYNTPSPIEGFGPGSNGIFNPNVSHSGTQGFSVGPYVLAVSMQADNVAPMVVATSISEGETLLIPPTVLSVRFSEAMNLVSLFNRAFELTSAETISAVSIRGEGGQSFHPRLISYDEASHVAQFLMLDGLPNGNYQLHLSGALGLRDRASHRLTPNDPSGDHVVAFSVDAPPRGFEGDVLVWKQAEPNDDLQPQNLGVLFPRELQSGVAIVREVDTDSSFVDSADVYRFEVIQDRSYFLTLLASNPATTFDIVAADGLPVLMNRSDAGDVAQFQLKPGVYELHLRGWLPVEAADSSYRVTLVLADAPANPPPISVGVRPASVTSFVTRDQPLGGSPGGSGPTPVLPPRLVPLTPGTPVSAPIVKSPDIATPALLLPRPASMIVIASSSVSTPTMNAPSLIGRVNFPASLSTGPIGGAESEEAESVDGEVPLLKESRRPGALQGRPGSSWLRTPAVDPSQYWIPPDELWLGSPISQQKDEGETPDVMVEDEVVFDESLNVDANEQPSQVSSGWIAVMLGTVLLSLRLQTVSSPQTPKGRDNHERAR